MPCRAQQGHFRSVSITQSPIHNRYSLYFPTRPDFSTSCVKHGATRSSLNRLSVRLDLMLAVASRTKRRVYWLQLEQWQMSLPWNKHSKWQTRKSYYVPYTVFITKMSNELSFTRMTQTLSKYVCTMVQRCGEICRNYAPHKTDIYKSTTLRLGSQPAEHCRSSIIWGGGRYHKLPIYFTGKKTLINRIMQEDIPAFEDFADGDQVPLGSLHKL